MIIPNLLVRDIAKSLAFYRDELGFSVMFMISADQQVLAAGQDGEAVFAKRPIKPVDRIAVQTAQLGRLESCQISGEVAHNLPSFTFRNT